MRSVDHPEIELKVAFNVIESVELGNIYGSYEVTSNLKFGF